MMDSAPSKALSFLVHANAFLLGFVIMGFEMIASRYMYPYFGGSIETWAALISVVLLALMLGYFIGGHLADKLRSPKFMGGIVIAAAFYIALVPLATESTFNTLSSALVNEKLALIAGAALILFIPIALLGFYTPYSISLILSSASESGKTAGRIYSISTLGNVAGTLLTTFYLIPNIGSIHLTFIFAIITFISGISFWFPTAPKQVAVLALALLFTTLPDARAEEVKWNGTRAMEDIANQLKMGSRAMGKDGHEKVITYITDEATKLTLTSAKQKWEFSTDGKSLVMTNIIVRMNPEIPRRIIVGTHYDSIVRAYKDSKTPDAEMPGANNSASGVALLLETMRYLQASGTNLNFGVDFVFFDGEEGPLSLGEGDTDWEPLGSPYFVSHLNEYYSVQKPQAAAIFDMVCYSKLQIHPDFTSLKAAESELKAFWKYGVTTYPAIFSALPMYNISDDHTAFNGAGIASFLVIGFEYAPWFNTTGDTLDKCAPASLEAVGDTLVHYLKSK